jgi:beta-galactosidase
VRYSLSLLVAINLGGVGMTAASADLAAEARPTQAGPELYVNRQAVCPTLFYVSLWHDPDLTKVAQSEIASAGKVGVRIISFAIWGLPWFKEGEAPDFSRYDVDVWVEKVLAANPDALLLPRFPTDWPPDWWREAHPDDVMLFDDGKRDGPASIHSPAWRRDAAQQVSAMVRHLEAKYGDHIIGYHPCGQTSAEWFFHGMWEGRLGGFEGAALTGFRKYLAAKYHTDERLRQAWGNPQVAVDTAQLPSAADRTAAASGGFRDPAAEQRVIDFGEFQNADMADAVEAMCRAVKEAAPGKLAVAFYGYHFELSGAPHGLASSGHLGLGRLLRSPYVDVLCSPVAYGDRQPGGGGYFMSPVDSVLLHGKLWLVEDDTRTHLSEPDAFPGRCSNARETYGVLTRNFAHVLTHGAALWWMDIGGRGWFAGDETWQRLSRLRDAYAAALPNREPYHPRIAAIVDERSCLYAPPSPAVTAPLLDGFRRQWYRIGAPIGIYLLDDLVAGKVPPAKLYVLLDTFRLDPPQIAAVRRCARRDRATVVWMYAPGIVRSNRLSPSFVQETTGIRLTETAEGDGNLILEGTGESFAAGHGHLSPTFAVADERARPLARCAATGAIAIAARRMRGWTSVYCGALQMPASLLRDLARQAGVHIYSDQGDVVTAGSGFVGLHASSAGRKRLQMPGTCGLTDIVTGETSGPASAFELDMELGDTRLMRVTR